MEVIKIVGFAIISLILILMVQEQRKEIAILISFVSGICILIAVVNEITPIINLLNSMAEKSGMNSEFFKVILKVTAIAYIIEIGRSMCIDSNQKALAEKLELAGKVIIVSISIPIITSLLNVITEMMVLL